MSSSVSSHTSSVVPIARKALVYCVSMGAEAAIAAALLPVLTGHLSPEEYGIWVLFVALFTFARPVISLMLPDALRMNFFQLSEEQMRNSLSAAISVPTFVFLVTLAAVQLGSSFLGGLLAFPGDSLWIVLLVAYLHGLFYTFLALMQFKERHSLFLIIQLVQAFFAITLALWFVHLGLSWFGAAAARCIALIIADVCGLIWICRSFGNPFTLRVPRATMRELIRIGTSFLPVGICAVLVPLSNRVVIAHLVGPQETGYFGIAALFALAITIVVQGFIFAWQPLLFRSLQTGRQEKEQKFHSFSLAFYAALPAVAVLILGAALLIGPLLVKYDLRHITPYLVSLCVASCMQGYYLHNHTWLHALKQLRVLSWTALLIMPVNFLLSIALVQSYGGVGAAWATAVTYALATAGTGVRLLRKETPPVMGGIVLERG